jgi:hypothetical protein
MPKPTADDVIRTIANACVEHNLISRTECDAALGDLNELLATRPQAQEALTIIDAVIDMVYTAGQKSVLG